MRAASFCSSLALLVGTACCTVAAAEAPARSSADPIKSRDALPTAAESSGPSPTTTWHLDIENPVDLTMDAQFFDIDMFDNESTDYVSKLHARGRKVICYFSAGSSEAARPDHGKLPLSAIGDKMCGWEEHWLDTRHAGVREVMKGRLDRAKAMGCDGVDADNMDGYTHTARQPDEEDTACTGKTGFPLTAKTQLDFNRFIAKEAHSRGLLVSLKNDVDQIAELVDQFDFHVNEQCFAFDECAKLEPFITSNKAVLNIEYGSVRTKLGEVCPQAKERRFFSILSEENAMNGTYTRCE